MVAFVKPPRTAADADKCRRGTVITPAGIEIGGVVYRIKGIEQYQRVRRTRRFPDGYVPNT